MDETMTVALKAQNTADAAAHAISTHEQVCAERYGNIKDRLQGIPRLFEMMEKTKDETTEGISSLARLVYIGMGICVSVPMIVEVLHYLEKK